MFVHLKGDLEVDPIDWLNCLDPYEASDDARPTSRRGPLTRYGIAKDIQELLSGIRTDLDSFSEAEAYALMTSAYRMTEYQFKYEKCVEGFDEPDESEPWKFLAIEKCMKGVGGGYDYLKKLLTAGSSLAFKVWQIDPLLKYVLRIFLVLIALSVGIVVYKWWDQPLPESVMQIGRSGRDWAALWLSQFVRGLTFKSVVTWLFGLFTAYMIGRIVQSIIGDYLAEKAIIFVRWKDTLRRIAIATFVSTLGWIAAVVHIYIFDRRFLRLGSMAMVDKKDSNA
jgi:hypothetical protein